MGSLLSKLAWDEPLCGGWLPSPRQLVYTLGWLGFWRALTVGVFPPLLDKHSAQFRNMSPAMRHMTVLYFNSSVHAVATTALGGFKLWRRMSTRPLFDKDGEEGKPVEVAPEVPQTLSSRNALSFTLAYFVNDFWELRTQLHKAKSNTFHHLLGIVMLTLGMGRLTPSTEWLVSPFLLMESSTIFLNNMWLLRAFNMEGSPVYLASVGAFVVLFFGSRVVGLPALVYSAQQKQPSLFKTLGTPLTTCLYGLGALQWYWFARICVKFGPVLLSQIM